MFEATYSIEIPFIYRATAVDTIFNESLAKSIRAAVNAPRATVPRYIISTSGRSWRVCVRGAFTKRIHEDLRVNRAASRTLFDSRRRILSPFRVYIGVPRPDTKTNGMACSSRGFCETSKYRVSSEETTAPMPNGGETARYRSLRNNRILLLCNRNVRLTRYVYVRLTHANANKVGVM